MKRFIFDLDYTLLIGDYSKENDLFRERLNQEAEKFISMKKYLLMDYERKHKRYDIKSLSEYLSKSSNINIPPVLIEEWINVNCNMNNDIEPYAKEVLKYLKDNNKSIVVLSNWFTKVQKERLRNTLLLKYIDQVYGGDIYLKPNKESYLNACGEYDIKDSIMIGDDLIKDVYAPRNIGLKSLYYNDNVLIHNSIKSLKKIKEMY